MNRVAAPSRPLTLGKPVGVVGPNAVLQLVQPLRHAGGERLLKDVFRRAGLERYLDRPPLAMVPEEEARSLFGAVRELMGTDRGDDVLREAGRGTAQYVMAHRIPGPVRGLLRILPAPIAARMLLSAIQRHAWTFAGSGSCDGRCAGGVIRISIRDNPLATPGCPWHAGVLETMFRTLVTRRATLHHCACRARGGDCCRFSLALGRPSKRKRRPPAR
jgi:divinyl protochlorophyllide a 8-vinyl-reductase